MTNIVKDKISFSDYIDFKNNEKLYKNETKLNMELIKRKKEKELFNLSIKEIINNFSKEFINMLNDIVYLIHKHYIKKENNENIFQEIILILIKDERLIYLGIFFILLSFFFYFMDISN